MTPIDAAKLLDLSADASPEQIQVRFLDLRAKLEDKIAKAPTPGLKEKYRTSLTQITEAFEILTIAADSSSLPILQRLDEPAATVAGVADPGSTRAPSPSPGSPTPAATLRRKSGGNEFLLVTLLAVALLAAGGWFIMKTRAENAEQVRIAAAAKAAADRDAELLRQAEEARKAKEIADVRAEQDRRDRLTVHLRTQLAEARIAWESLENEARTTERALSDLRSELRNASGGKASELQARVNSTQRYLEWVTAHLEKHPVRITRAKVEELLSARMPDDAQPAMQELQGALAALAREIPERKRAFLSLDGSLKVESDPAGLAFTLIDAFGRSQTGTTPTTLKGIAPGTAQITFRRDGFANVQSTATIQTGQTVAVRGVVKAQTMVFSAESNVNFWVDGKFVGRGSVTLRDLAPGRYKLQFAPPDITAYPMEFEVKQAVETVSKSFSYAALARKDRSCSPCRGQGTIKETPRCSSCRGAGKFTCKSCDGWGNLKMNTSYGVVNWPCSNCRKGVVTCNSCAGEGRLLNTRTCSGCNGEGQVSQLQLAYQR
ncbi:MAG: PEGA domain-containing protein [Candidatus Didemnitutus sp.]|nr:PEGA domain-containing protein [Candidatus Didemnitutus sp.]